MMMIAAVLLAQVVPPAATPPAAAATPSAPSAEAIALGREIAESGTLAALLPLVAQRDVEELIAANPTLTPDEQTRLRAIGTRVFTAGMDRVMSANGRAFAERLSLEQLRAIAAFNRTPEAQALRAATPAAMIATIQAIGSVDLKKDIQEAFCREANRLCPAN